MDHLGKTGSVPIWCAQNKYCIDLHLQNKLEEMVAEKDSLDAQLVTVNEEKRALLAAERELTSKMVSITYCWYSIDYTYIKIFLLNCERD